MENKLEVIKLPEIKSIPDIIKHSDKLLKIKDSDERKVEEEIAIVIVEVFNFYNEPPNNVQAKLIALELKEAFAGLTIPDLHIFKDNCLKGKYELKFRLAPNVFAEWINQYKDSRGKIGFEEEAKIIEEKRENELKQYSEKTIEFLKDLANRIKEKQDKLKPIYSTDTSREEQQRKELQKHLTKEFEYLWEKQGKNEFDRGRGKYVFHKQGSQMLPDYLSIRFREIYANADIEYQKERNTFVFKHKQWTELGADKSTEPIYPNYSDFIFEQVNKIIK